MRKILIVDDMITNREILKKILGDEYDIVEASDGKEAIELMNRNYKMLSAIVLDLMMPVMDGYEVLRIRSENAALMQIPAIVVTSSNDEDVKVKALAYGANDFIIKPYNTEIIRHCLRNTIRLRENASILNALRRDKLTGIFSREAFFDTAEEKIKLKSPGTYILSCFDIDNFKIINDQFGAPEGDRILKNIAQKIKEACDDIGGICGRISADNFAALYPNTCEAVLKITECRELNFLSDNLRASLSISVGRYIVTDKALPVSSMYDRAFIAKRSVKGMYDNHVAFFDDSMLENLVGEQRIIGEMDKALSGKQFEVWLQPQINHMSGALTGAEALVRWRHPEKGLISPGVFIPIFEKNGFIYELDKYVWEQVCIYLRKWTDEGKNPVPVSVNISRYDIFRDDLVSTINSLIEKYKVPRKLLRLEVTESVFAKSGKQLIEVVKNLIDFGYTVEIDDFGSGYSSLNTLKEVPANVLKLDMRFFESSGDSQRGGNILESIVRMAKWIGMETIAEGVEEKSQADFLCSIGCDCIQGYLYAKPMPASEYEKFSDKLKKENGISTLETVKNLDNNAFWDPDSIDTLIFNSYVGGACIIEYCNGKAELIRASQKYTEMFGGGDMSVRDRMKINWLDYLSEDSVRMFKDFIRKSIVTREEVTCDFMFENLPGYPPKTYLRSNMRIIASAGERYMIYCITENITAQRNAENKEHNLNEQLKLLTDSMPGGLATYEVKNGVGKLIYFNDRFCRTLGFTRDEYEKISSENPASRVFSEDIDALKEQIKNLLENGVPLNCTYRVHTKDGGYKWLKHRAVITENNQTSTIASSVFFDITDEYESGERLRVREEEYRLAMQASGKVICRYSVADKTLTLKSETAKLISTPEIIKNVPYSMVESGAIAPESEKTYIALYEEIINGKKSGSATYQRNTVKGFRWISADYQTIFSYDGKPVSAVITVADVTERLEKENIYKKWQQSLDEKDKGSYTLIRCNLNKSTLIDSISGSLLRIKVDNDEISFNERAEIYANMFVYDKDLDKYLKFMNSDALLVKYYHGKKSDALEYREKTGDGGYRWLRLTVDLVAYTASKDIEAYLMYENINDAKKAELKAIERAETDALTGVLNRVAFATKMDYLIQNSEPDSKHAMLMLDIDGFKLVNDAFGHMTGDKALVDIASVLRSLFRKEDIVGRLGGDEFVMFISNIPNDAAVAKKAQEVCAATQIMFSAEVGISSSIGIVICPRDGASFASLYKKADAALYYVKGSGKNNYMFFRDGIEEENLKPETPKHEGGIISGNLKKRMLIVDDNSIDFKLLENMFKDEFIIEKATDGNSALVRLRHYGSAISVVLLDLFMPGMNGFEVLERMQQSVELQSIPVIVVSGDDNRETSLKVIRCGAADFINKPVDTELLRLRVKSAVSKAENERLRVQNSFLKLQNDEAERYRTVLEHTGISVIEHDWVNGTFIYDRNISAHIAGIYDNRKLWRILLSDMVADTATVRNMQEYLRMTAEDRRCTDGTMLLRLKTPSRVKHWFRMNVYKKENEFKLTDKLILTFIDLGADFNPEE